MYYGAELDYLMNVLKKIHLPARRILMENVTDHELDLGMRRILNLREDYERTFHANILQSKNNMIYKISDSFLCNYLFFLLPHTQQPQIIFIGPYVTLEFTNEGLLEMAERLGLPTGSASLLASCFSNVAILHDEAMFLSMVNAFGEVLWENAFSFEIIDVYPEFIHTASPLSEDEHTATVDDILFRMQIMETRYAYENELMEMVASGQRHRTELMLSHFSGLNFEQRMPDPVRNLKNYGIICNTLMRKAAEKGGVHPVYLDSISSDFARKIEALNSLKSGQKLLSEMARDYCLLVRKHSHRHYSPTIQKTMAYIEVNLTGDLSLRTLAGVQNISAGYLSALFSKETGRTLTKYVNERRIETAERLLGSTRLQVQTIAQYCGITDVNYFSKLFKKQKGITPKQYRENAFQFKDSVKNGANH